MKLRRHESAVDVRRAGAERATAGPDRLGRARPGPTDLDRAQWAIARLRDLGQAGLDGRALEASTGRR